MCYHGAPFQHPLSILWDQVETTWRIASYPYAQYRKKLRFLQNSDVSSCVYQKKCVTLQPKVAKTLQTKIIIAC